MDYNIEMKTGDDLWTIIANFEYNYDRDLCLECFIKQYPNYLFRKGNNIF